LGLKELESPISKASSCGTGNRHTKPGRLGFDLERVQNHNEQGFAHMWKTGEMRRAQLFAAICAAWVAGVSFPRQEVSKPWQGMLI
jgi:hypothetical protein